MGLLSSALQAEKSHGREHIDYHVVVPVEDPHVRLSAGGCLPPVDADQDRSNTSLSPSALMRFLQPIKCWLKFLASSFLATVIIFTIYHPIGSAFRTSEQDQVQFEIAFQSSTQDDNLPTLQTDDIERRILDAAPILGFYEQSDGRLSNWMSGIPDDVPITSMSIPGAHDAATWNYTQATQDLLEPVTGKIPPAIAYQCHDRSLFQMLGDGIRFFDFRVGFLPGHKQLGFFHSAALLSTTATLPDVLLGFYKWLDDHPSETILISIKVDNATFGSPPSNGQPSSRRLQLMIYELLTQSELARNHWLQEDSKLGTLGQARGKMIFVQRIDWNEVRGADGYAPIGIALPPGQFEVNSKNFTIEYNREEHMRAFVEDFYNILPNPTSVEEKFALKFAAVQAHLGLAARADPQTVDQLFITFASGGALLNIPPVTPKMLAIGTGEGESLRNAVNERIARLIQEEYTGGVDNGEERKRLGILIFDWYHQVPSLILSVISQNPSLPANHL